MKRLGYTLAAIAFVFGGAYLLGFFSGEGAIETESQVAVVDETAHESVAEPHIAWFEGTVEEAFAKAEAEAKPVLLYWGAVWCPPCNQLKATIFKRPDFVAKTDKFVAVYLDGDTDRAQKYGEEFGNAGYPTLIILNGRDNEVTRIPGGMNLEAYVHVLDLALAKVSPVAQLLEEIVDNGRQATVEELSLLAHYSWGQDRGRALGERDKTLVFNTLAQMIPDSMAEEKARLEAEYLVALGKVEEDLDEAVRSEAIDRAEAHFSDPVATRAYPFFATFYAKGFVEKVSEEGSEDRERLVAALTDSLAIMAKDDSYTPAGRLRVHFGEARLAKLVDGEVSDDLIARVRTNVDRELTLAKTEYERSAVMNAAVGTLIETDQNDYAALIMKHELESSANAYYWMSDLASLAEEAEQEDEAVKWLKMAYDEATGLATRAQWGAYYVDGLARMRSDDVAAVQAAAAQVLGELGAQEDPIYGRNKGSVKRIARALNTWASGGEEAEGEAGVDFADREAALAKVTETFDGICATHFEAGDKLEACKALFRPVEA